MAEPESGHGTDTVPALIPQPHGGALRPPMRRGERSRNPSGVNGWTRSKERLEEALEDGLAEKLAQAIVALVEERNVPMVLALLDRIVPRKLPNQVQGMTVGDITRLAALGRDEGESGAG